MSKAKTFDKKRINWLELWQGPFVFRASFHNGVYSQGHTLAEIESLGLERLHGIAQISLSAPEGAVVIDWIAGPRGSPRREALHTGLSMEWVNQLGEATRRESAGQLSDDNKKHLAVLTVVSSIRACLEREFRQAIDAGQCMIMARVGSRAAAAFTEIPPDVFRAYRVASWGHGVVGGARAEGENLPTLFSLCVRPLIGKKIISANEPVAPGKAGRRPNAAWRDAVEIVARLANDKKFARPLKRGQKTQLEKWLCEEVESVSGKSLSENAARRYVDQVIEQLPHKSA